MLVGCSGLYEIFCDHPTHGDLFRDGFFIFIYQKAVWKGQSLLQFQAVCITYLKIGRKYIFSAILANLEISSTVILKGVLIYFIFGVFYRFCSFLDKNRPHPSSLPTYRVPAI